MTGQAADRCFRTHQNLASLYFVSANRTIYQNIYMCAILVRRYGPVLVEADGFCLDLTLAIRYNDEKCDAGDFMEQKYPHNTGRSSIRQKTIEDCLLRQMAVMPYDKVSVADMCRQMDISRRLYYTYFPDRESCLISLVDRIIHESMDFSPGPLNLRTPVQEMIIAYLCFWRVHAGFLDVIVKQRLKGLLVERSYVFFLNDGSIILPYLNNPDVESDSTALWLYSAIRYAVIFQWHEHHFEEPVEEVAVKYERMLKTPLMQDIF